MGLRFIKVRVEMLSVKFLFFCLLSCCANSRVPYPLLYGTSRVVRLKSTRMYCINVKTM